MANPGTKILAFGEFDSGRVLTSGGGILRSIRDLPDFVGQRISVGTITLLCGAELFVACGGKREATHAQQQWPRQGGGRLIDAYCPFRMGLTITNHEIHNNTTWSIKHIMLNMLFVTIIV